MAAIIDIHWSYDAGLEMATGDFFHCDNVPDNTKSYWFKKMLQLARLVRKDFNIPDRNETGGMFFMFYV